MIHLALSLLLAGPIPDTCPMPRPEEAPCAAKATTFDAGICTVCTLRTVAGQQEGRAATCNAALGSCQGAQSNGAAVLALGTAGGVAAVTGGFLVGQKHLEVGLGVLGVGLLLELAGLHEAGVIRFP